VEHIRGAVDIKKKGGGELKRGMYVEPTYCAEHKSYQVAFSKTSAFSLVFLPLCLANIVYFFLLLYTKCE
jgi:hypothetical protein